MKKRCFWVPEEDALYVDYHDKEWGVPIYDDRLLFEFLILEGMQAGLSWITVLKKRENYRKLLYNFDAEVIVKNFAQDYEKLCQDKRIIRNKLKILSLYKNSVAFLKLVDSGTNFSDYLWRFEGKKTVINSWKRSSDIPLYNEISIKMSKDLKKRGFSFVGPTICYSFMQAVGMVNDHLIDCFRYKEIIKKQK